MSDTANAAPAIADSMAKKLKEYLHKEVTKRIRPGTAAEQLKSAVKGAIKEFERIAKLPPADAGMAAQWAPMSSAPKDGCNGHREILLLIDHPNRLGGCMFVGHWMDAGPYEDGFPCVDEGWYFWNGCMFDKAAKPLAWMPLPPPPDKSSPQQASSE